jgi:hypothetical protein
MALFGFVVYGRVFLISGGEKNRDSSRFSDFHVLVQKSAGQQSGVSWKLRKSKRLVDFSCSHAKTWSKSETKRGLCICAIHL